MYLKVLLDVKIFNSLLIERASDDLIKNYGLKVLKN